MAGLEALMTPKRSFVAKLSHRRREILLVVSLVAGVLALMSWFGGRVKAGPPRSVTLAAGPKGGAYFRFAQQYAAKLAVKGLDVKVLETGGSLENLRLLREGKADIGFVQSGLGSQNDNLQALGSTFLEPLWLFTRTEKPVEHVTELFGKSVAIGDTDSGTREVVLTVLDDTKMRGKLKTL